jgi:hypothetical protein
MISNVYEDGVKKCGNWCCLALCKRPQNSKTLILQDSGNARIFWGKLSAITKGFFIFKRFCPYYEKTCQQTRIKFKIQEEEKLRRNN